MDALTKTVKARELTRQVKMSQLKSIVIEGENSVAEIQQSILDASQVSYGGFNSTNSPHPNSMKFSSSPKQHSPTARQNKSADRASRQTTREAHAKLVYISRIIKLQP